jgi:hypothetical protein
MAVATKTASAKNKQVLTFFDFEQGSEEWHNERDGFYSGSNAEKLLDFSEHTIITSGEISLYAAAHTTGFRGTFHTKRGHLLEPEAISLYEEIEGVKVNHTGLVKNSLYPKCVYSPDGFTETVLIEVKCFDVEQHLKLWNGDIPLKILAQIHYGLTIMHTLKVAHLVIYNPKLVNYPKYGPKYAYKKIIVRRDREIIGNFKRILSSS